ncbi:MAG: hypothetical protein AB7T27_12230 [Kiritimatiellia bacterium]
MMILGGFSRFWGFFEGFWPFFSVFWPFFGIFSLFFGCGLFFSKTGFSVSLKEKLCYKFSDSVCRIFEPY